MPGDGAIVGLGGPLGDVDHVRDPVLALPGLAAGAPQRPSGAQAPGQVAAQRSAGLHVQRLIDGLGRHAHLRVLGELLAQPAGDLLRRVAPLQILLHLLSQRQVGGQLRWLGPPGALVGERVRGRRAIRLPAAAGVTPKLAADRRRAAPKPPSDRSHRLTTRTRQRDLLALRERQTAALQIPTATRAHPTGRDQPPSSLLAIGTCLGGGVGDELTSLHGRPEPLHNLSDHSVREPRHRRLRSPRHDRRAPPQLTPPVVGSDSAPITAGASPSGSASRRPARYSTTAGGRVRKSLDLRGVATTARTQGGLREIHEELALEVAADELRQLAERRIDERVYNGEMNREVQCVYLLERPPCDLSTYHPAYPELHGVIRCRLADARRLLDDDIRFIEAEWLEADLDGKAMYTTGVVTTADFITEARPYLRATLALIAAVEGAAAPDPSLLEEQRLDDGSEWRPVVAASHAR